VVPGIVITRPKLSCPLSKRSPNSLHLIRVCDLRIGDRLEYSAPQLPDLRDNFVARDDRCPVPVRCRHRVRPATHKMSAAPLALM
jgi:hypothetical protein